MNLRIILDLDEVLAEWVEPVCKAFGLTKGQVLEHWPVGEYSGITKALNDCLTARAMHHDDGKGVTDERLWDKIRSVPFFWEELPILPWAHDLVAMVDKISHGNWLIVTQGQPVNDLSSYAGKVRWIQSKFGLHFNRFGITCHKQEYARKDTILIDDSETNCKAFQDNRGAAILFPRHHNSRHMYKDNPLEVIERSLARWY